MDPASESIMSVRNIYLLSFLWLTLASAQPAPVVIKAGHFVNVLQGEVLNNVVIVIEGQRIKAVGPDVAIPAGAIVTDLSDAWVLPGLIDCHTHITFQMGDYYEDLFRKSPIDEAVYAHVYARNTLNAGFTTCRNVGADEFIDVALKKVIDAGKVPGPRLFVSGQALSATGGHGDLNGFSPYLHFSNANGVVDGVDEIRKKIRSNIK